MFAAINAFLTRAVSGYFLNKSLRFRASASAYLNRTFAAGNQKTWTWSGWVKRGTLSNYPVLFSIGSGSLSSNYGAFRFNDGTNKFEIFDATNNMGVSSIVWESTAVYRDPAAWYHIVVVLDTTQASAVNRFSLYVNGIIQVGSFTVTPAQNANCLFNQAANHTIGIFAGNYASTSKSDGEMAEINFVDGQALAPTAFGAYSIYNQWLPIRYAGTYGTNGFYLPFTNTTSTSTLVADSSGNANNWTPNNISLTAGSTYDSLTDVPTLTSETVANYCVMNPLFFNGNQCTLSDGNLTIYKAGASYGSQLSTIGFPTTGKFYFETTIVSSSATNNQAMGIASSTATYVFALDCFYTGSLIRTFVDGSVTTGYGSASNGMVIGVAVDATNGKAYIAINNTWIDSSSPTGGTNGYSMTSGVQYFGWFQGYNSGASAYNFGQQPFTYTAPSGFLPLNTFNI